jgi:ectoine hydroxylase-related dioxygenase (phytanoyl-CoA dioxygenase family)
MQSSPPLLCDTDYQLVASRPEEPDTVLRERFAEYGYLYFPAFVDGEECDALLAEILEKTAPRVVPGEAGPVLMGEPFFETDPAWDELYPEVQSLERLHAFFHTAQMRSLQCRILGAEPFVYPMKMARISTPRKIGYETPPHQDAHSHQAGSTMAGVWVALHDIPASLGRLKLLARSHTRGVRPVFQAEGVGGIQCEIYPEETEWHVSDYRRGDVVISHACTVHMAEPNLEQDAVRISVDTRFCDHGAPVFRTNVEPHHGWRIPRLDWEYIYREWREDTLQYYWRDYPALTWEPLSSAEGKA